MINVIYFIANILHVEYIINGICDAWSMEYMVNGIYVEWKKIVNRICDK